MSSPSALHDGGDTGTQRKLTNSTLSFSAPAAAHVKEYLLREGKGDSPIRVAAVRTHCMGGRGFDYRILEDTAKEGDVVVKSEELTLLVDPESMGHLMGAKIDFEGGLQDGGLVVHNPNAVGKCHCGRHDILDVKGDAGAEGC